jgi:serine protease Do
MSRKYLGLALLLLVSMLVFTGCSPEATKTTSNQSTNTLTTSTSSSTNITSQTLADLENSLEDIYTRVNQSVVNIEVTQKQQSSSFEIPGFSFSTPQQQYTQALGSGFIWDNDGHIVTNNHVVADADSITVTFYDGTIVPAKLVGADADSDLAVIKADLPADKAKPVELANSTQLKVGQLAIAIGNPFGLQGTMTVGFISAIGRVLAANENTTGASYSIPDMIQTDAAINPGNSGGVLLDDTGKVIGVTSSIATTSGTSAGVGFAIPSAIVEQVVPDLIKAGHYDHPYFGMTLMTLTPDLAKAMGLPTDDRGALVESVTAGGPADKAGIKGSDKQTTVNGQNIQVGGDVIIAYNGEIVKSSDDLVTLLARHGTVGQTVILTIIRDGKQIETKVTLGARPNAQNQ